MIKMRFASILFAGFFLISACSQRSKMTDYVRQQDLDVAGYFSDSVTEFVVDVFYEASAVPFTGPLENSENTTWDITDHSFKELFKAHTNRRVIVPHELSEMIMFADRKVTSWDEKQLIALADSLIRPPTATRQTASVIYISGSYLGERTVLGIHFSGYKVAFIFKDNLSLFSGGTSFLRRIEQATVVHELGHVIGLVNNGLPMQVPHEDPEHPHHTTDPDDVMYWDLVGSANRADKLMLFGKKSLADAQGFHKP